MSLFKSQTYKLSSNSPKEFIIYSHQSGQLHSTRLPELSGPIRVEQKSSQEHIVANCARTIMSVSQHVSVLRYDIRQRGLRLSRPPTRLCKPPSALCATWFNSPVTSVNHVLQYHTGMTLSE